MIGIVIFKGQKFLTDNHLSTSKASPMTSRWRLELSLLLAFLSLISPLAQAQAGKAEFFGVILDASGLPVPQATVELEDQATLVKHSSSTSERGEYHFFGLGPGIYRVSVVKQGFREYRQEGLQLRVADRISLDIRLELGDVVQALEVTAAAPLLQATTGTVSLVVEQKWTQLHTTAGSFARRGLAAGFVLPTRQWEPTTDKRVYLRRYWRSTAGTWAGGILPDHRRD
jgi:hypothetical protein